MANEKADDLACMLRELITAVEIVDGQEHPPDSDDVDHLHDVIEQARNLLVEAGSHD